MLIRSQDKLDVIIVENASRISIEKSQNGFPIRTRSFKETWFLLGFYKSNETALKVLDDIMRAYHEGCRMFDMPEEKMEDK